MAIPFLFYRLSSPWPVGAVLIPSGTVVDTSSLQGSYLRDLIPPYDVQALDMTTYDFLQQFYWNLHHLMGLPPKGSG